MYVYLYLHSNASLRGKRLRQRCVATCTKHSSSTSRNTTSRTPKCCVCAFFCDVCAAGGLTRDVHNRSETFTIVRRRSRRFRDVHNRSETFTIVRRCSQSFGDVYNLSEPFRDVQSFGAVRSESLNLLESFTIFRRRYSQSFGAVHNLSETFTIFRSRSETFNLSKPFVQSRSIFGVVHNLSETFTTIVRSRSG